MELYARKKQRIGWHFQRYAGRVRFNFLTANIVYCIRPAGEDWSTKTRNSGAV